MLEMSINTRDIPFELKTNFYEGERLMVSRKAVNMMLASAVALTVAGGVGSAEAMKKEGKEKCYGVVKAGHNDCGSADKSHSCAGYAKTDGDVNEWVALPTGTCDKLAGGTLTPGGDKSATEAVTDAVVDHGKKMMEDHSH